MVDERRRTHTDGQKSTFYFGLEDMNGDELTSSPSFVAGDSQIMLDGGAWTNTTNLPQWRGNGVGSVVLTTAEMTCQIGVLRVKDQDATEVWRMVKFTFHTGGDSNALLDGT